TDDDDDKNEDGGEGSSRSPIYTNLLAHYRAKAELLRTVVLERVQAYQVEHVEGYDLWGGPHQAPRAGSKRSAFAMPELPLDEDFDLAEAFFYGVPLSHWKGTTFLPAPAPLASPGSAQTWFDPALLIAHHLGLGQIKLRWTSPGREDERVVTAKDNED